MSESRLSSSIDYHWAVRKKVPDLTHALGKMGVDSLGEKIVLSTLERESFTLKKWARLKRRLEGYSVKFINAKTIADGREKRRTLKRIKANVENFIEIINNNYLKKFTELLRGEWNDTQKAIIEAIQKEFSRVWNEAVDLSIAVEDELNPHLP